MRHTIRIALISAVCLLLLAAAATAAPVKFARYPHVSSGKLVFAYHGDLWIANADGTRPARLTAHVSRNTFPRLSPDGKWVAFTSNRMGNDDVWVIPASGGEARQLTFHSTGDTVVYWTPDGKRIIFTSNRSGRTFGSPLYTVAVDGGLPEPLPMDVGTSGMIKQDGSMIAFNRVGARYWRKGYQGNASDDIYVQDLKTKTITQLTGADLQAFRTKRQTLNPMWGADGMIYFSSERDGIFNIWKMSPTGGDPTQVTSHKQDGVQFPSMSPDGKTIAYENEFEIWTLAVPGGSPKKVAIDLEFDPKENLIQFVKSNGRIDGFSPSPDGDYAAVDFHGEIFIVPTDPEVGERRQVTSSSWRDRRELFSPNGRHVAYTSDESKEEEIWLFDRQTGARKQLTTHASFKSGGAWSPDSKQLAYVAANRLFIADIEAVRSVEVAYNIAGGYQGVSFSPDGKWLVYSRRDEDQNADVYLYDLAGKKEYDVTPNPFSDTRAIFTSDGKRLVFLSDRDGGVTHLFVVTLDRAREDPDDPLVKERLKKARADKKEKEDAAAAGVKLDVAGIDRRVLQLTRGTEADGAFFLSSDGRLVYFVSSDEKGRGLFSVGIDGKDRKRVSDGAFAGLTPTADGKKVFYTQDGELYQMEMAGEKKKTKVNTAVTVKIDNRVEWQQIFDECWRVMKYQFYDERMHGRDWNAVKATYEPLSRRPRSPQMQTPRPARPASAISNKFGTASAANMARPRVVGVRSAHPFRAAPAAPQTIGAPWVYRPGVVRMSNALHRRSGQRVASTGAPLMIPPMRTTPELDTSKSEAAFQAACRVMPGGVNSPVRAFRGVGGTPRFIAKGKGAVITDVDGNNYIDYVGSWGPLILGHADDRVVVAIDKAAAKGCSFGAPTEAETQLAELIIARVPSIELVRFVNSGTEATMSAIRLARGFTGRNKIIKFEGCYHGHCDALLVKAGSGALTLGAPSSPGVPKGTTADTLVLPYNDLGAVEKALRMQGQAVAAVLVEPITGNMGCVPPNTGYLAGLRSLCTEHGVVLIFDEVMTGFRVAAGGAQQLYGVQPDLTCLGKIVGGGLPMAAYGGRRQIMEMVSPLGAVYQAGTLSGNPLAMAAGIAVLEALAEPDVYPTLEARSAKLAEGLQAAADAAEVPLYTTRVGSMMCGFFSAAPVTDHAWAIRCNTKQYAAFFHAMLNRGVYLAPSQFECLFVSLAHTDEQIDETVAAAQEAFKVAAAGG